MTGPAGAVGAPPAHYETQSGLQPFDVIDAHGMGFYDGNALKYLLRHGRKGEPLEDLRKAVHYLSEAILRQDRGDLRCFSVSGTALSPARVIEEFGLTSYVEAAVDYLLSWRTSSTPDEDLRTAKCYAQLAVKELETHELARERQLTRCG